MAETPGEAEIREKLVAERLAEIQPSKEKPANQANNTPEKPAAVQKDAEVKDVAVDSAAQTEEMYTEQVEQQMQEAQKEEAPTENNEGEQSAGTPKQEGATQQSDELPTSAWHPLNLWAGVQELWSNVENFGKDPIGSFTMIARKIGSLFEEARNGLAVMLGPTIESLVSLPFVGELIVGLDRTRSAFFTFLEKHGLSVDLSDTTKTVSLFLQEYKKQWKETYPSFDDFMDAVVPYLEGGAVTVAGLFTATEKLKKGEKLPDGTKPVPPAKETPKEKPENKLTVEKADTGIRLKWPDVSYIAKAENNNIVIGDTPWKVTYGKMNIGITGLKFSEGKVVINTDNMMASEISRTPEQIGTILTKERVQEKAAFTDDSSGLTFTPSV